MVRTLRRGRGAAVAVLGDLAVALTLLSAGVGLLALAAQGADGYAVVDVLLAFGLVAVPLVGRALVRSRARSPLGWVLLGSGCGAAAKLGLDTYARAVMNHGAAFPHAAAAEFASSLAGTGALALSGIAPLLLDRLPAGRRWRFVLAGAAALLACSVADDFAPTFWHFPAVANPWGPGGGAGAVLGALSVVVIVGQNPMHVAAALGVGAALRESDGAAAGGRRRGLVLMRRVMWVVTAAYLACLLFNSLAPIQLIYAVEHLTLALFAGCAWIEVVHDELIDVRRVLERTLRYAVLTTLAVLGSVLLAVAVEHTTARHVTPVVAVVLACAVALPLRDLVQRAAARVVWGTASEPSTAVSTLATRLSSAASPGATLDATARTLGETLRVDGVRIEAWTGEAIAEWGTPRNEGTGVGRLEHELVFGGERVGRLVLVPAPGEVRLPRRSRQSVGEVCPHVAAAVQAITSTRELAASRSRILRLRDEERQRIRRDLHDELGPTLAGLGLGIDRAREEITRCPDDAAATLTRLGGHARRAAQDVRRLVHDLYPTQLREHGLVAALADEADRLGVRMEVGSGWSRLGTEVPDQVEVAAYRIAQEAMTNAIRHSGAAEVRLGLDLTSRDRGAVLVVEVTDDGRGIGPGTRPGLGIRSMEDRTRALGGACTVSRTVPGRSVTGTVVRAELPVVPYALDAVGTIAPPSGHVPAPAGLPV